MKSSSTRPILRARFVCTNVVDTNNVNFDLSIDMASDATIQILLSLSLHVCPICVDEFLLVRAGLHMWNIEMMYTWIQSTSLYFIIIIPSERK